MPHPNAKAGFTIIEVLIVLAIAGLILIVVFLAVPAVQRSQRNQTRKTDAKALMAATTEFASNNGGVPPASQANVDTTTSNMKLGYLKSVNVFYGTAPTATVAIPSTTPAVNVNTSEEANVFVGYTCTSATAAATNTGATVRSVAVQYVLEQASGPGLLQCLSN
jgi:prepilin-type N-terminal cleavage/methylation domain-containing protein